MFCSCALWSNSRLLTYGLRRNRSNFSSRNGLVDIFQLFSHHGVSNSPTLIFFSFFSFLTPSSTWTDISFTVIFTLLFIQIISFITFFVLRTNLPVSLNTCFLIFNFQVVLYIFLNGSYLSHHLISYHLFSFNHVTLFLGTSIALLIPVQHKAFHMKSL